MSSYIHDVLSRWSKQSNWPYLSSILMVNKNIPYLEEEYGKHDYLWLLEITKNRQCKEIEPCVTRYVNGKNLSLDPTYRARDYQIINEHLSIQGNIEGIRRLNATRAKYFYKMQNYIMARHHFRLSDRSLKNFGYYLTSYFPPLARWIVRKYNVFG